jgi:hypothetical protein
MVSIGNKNLQSNNLGLDSEQQQQQLREFKVRAKRITFFKNGDQYFTGKTVNIIPNRYVTFTDLMNDLNRTVDLPYGVRRIYTPNGGSEVKRIGDLNDGQSYVCASFEPFRSVKYGDMKNRHWNVSSSTSQSPTNESRKFCLIKKFIFFFP